MCSSTPKSLFASHVTEAISRFHEAPEKQRRFRQVETTLALALDTLEQYPRHYTVKLRESFKPEDYAPRGRSDLLFAAQFEEVAQLGGYLLLGNAYKLQTLTEDLVDGLNRHRFLVVVNAARALLESMALVEHLAKRDRTALGPILDISPKKLAKAVRTEMKIARPIAKSPAELEAVALCRDTRTKLLKCQRYLRTQIQLRKSNILDGGGTVPDDVQQTNILTMIKSRLKYPEGEATPLESYEALCEFVHPNGSSYGLFVNQVDPKGTKAREFRLRARPDDWTLYIVVLELIALPVVEGLGAVLGTIEEMKNRWAGLENLQRDFRLYSKT